jgi:hypothetical protein
MSRKPHEAWGGFMASLIDAVDTLWIMGMKATN